MNRDFTSNLIEKLGKMSERDILAAETDGAYFAALSPDRVNVIEWFPFRKDQSVLQAGAEYGAYLGLADRVASWTVYDADAAALDVVRARSKAAAAIGTEPEKSGQGSETEKRTELLNRLPEKHFDILFIASWPGMERALRMIRQTTPEIVLILAENANALRFAAGTEKDPEKQYASAKELEELADCIGSEIGAVSVENGMEQENGRRSAGFRLYYPLPDLRFAKDIRSDRALPGPGDFRGVGTDFAGDRLVSCDEEALYDALASHDAASIKQFAPGYLAVLCAADTKLPDYIRYNRSRRPEFEIRTDLYYGEKVVKSALTEAADAHILGFQDRYERLMQNASGDLELLSPEISRLENGRAAAAFSFVPGRSLGHRLAGKIRNGKAPEQEMEELLGKLLGNGTGLYNIDLLFDNVLAENGKYRLIDYEWTSGEPLDPRFVRYRALRYFYEDNSSSLTAYHTLKDYLTEFGFSEQEYREFEQQENAFQLHVHGDDKGSFENRFRKEVSSVAHIRETARQMYADEIEELKATLSKERETERLSQQHIRNIEAINRARDAEIAALKAEVSWLRAHVSLYTKGKRRLIAKLDAWAPADSGRRLVIRYLKGTLRHPKIYGKRYLTAEGHNFIRGNFAIRGEFSEGGILELPKLTEGKTPLVSIVIPAYNQVGYTYACIRSILEHTDAEVTPYEVILADDASLDATAEITNWIRNLKVARTRGNLGFLKNCNNAAALAQGEFIFFLNNDTKVTDGWLSSLTGLMQRDESIGMCGSKLVFPDGRLQEAGGIIWSDGSGWNFGRMDDPDRFPYNYVKDVDYISGAAILIRSWLWREIGGFDERFAPAYCEDSDLAFEVRRHGKRVVYQPDSVVIHFEGVSNGTDVNGTGLKHYQLVNQEKFREKWAEELARQSVNTGNPNPFAARERSQKKKTILVVDHYVPRWDQDAGSKTTFQYLQMFLKKGYNVKFLGDDFRREENYAHELMQMGIEVLYGEEIRDSIFSWLEENREFIDIAYLNRPHIAVKYIDFLKEKTKIRCIFYGHDLHYLRIWREYELTGDIRKRRESETWRGLEYQVMEKADMVYYPSQDEIDEIKSRRPEIRARAITAYIYDKPAPGDSGGADGNKGQPSQDPSQPEGTDFSALKTSGLLFVGGFRHPPNADGVLWFAREIWPAIHASLPDISFYVAGSGPTPEVLELSGKEGIEILGFVSDERLEELYRTTRLTVVPLRYGAGVKGKVVEALDKNCVIVTTSVGAEGIPEAETAMRIVDAPDSFAREVIRLYQDPEELARRRAAAAPLIAKHYSTEAAWSVIAEDFV